MRIAVRGEAFELLRERCLFWPSQRLLVVADCHFGKAETFQRNGLWLPSAPVRQDFSRLSRLTDRLLVKHVLFLGDLVHSLAGVTEEVVRDFADWLNGFPGHVQMVVGNHDTGLTKRWPTAWRSVQLQERLRIGDFVFQHRPPGKPLSPRTFHWAGHVHPVVPLDRGPDRVRLPAFIISKSQGLLPAFSHVVGGFDMFPSDRDRVFVVGEQEVHEV